MEKEISLLSQNQMTLRSDLPILEDGVMHALKPLMNFWHWLIGKNISSQLLLSDYSMSLAHVKQEDMGWLFLDLLNKRSLINPSPFMAQETKHDAFSMLKMP